MRALAGVGAGLLLLAGCASGPGEAAELTAETIS